jgi:hypothetical protein
MDDISSYYSAADHSILLDNSFDHAGKLNIAIDLAYFIPCLDRHVANTDPITKYMLIKKFGLNLWDVSFYSTVDAEVMDIIETLPDDHFAISSRRTVQYYSVRVLFDLIEDSEKPS